MNIRGGVVGKKSVVIMPDTQRVLDTVNAGIFLTSRAGLILTIFGQSKIDHPDHHGFTASVGGTGKKVPPAFLRSFIR